MLRAEHLSVAYGAHRALQDVSVHVDRGEICVILGANGAGKSTLLRTIAGLVQPAPGAHIAIGEDDLSGRPANEIVEAGVALVPEGRGIFGDLTVAENLALGAYGRQARDNRDQRLASVFELFPALKSRRKQVARTMSGGEQQMVAIGRALMSNPKVLMLDEPSLGLSPLLCGELFKSLKVVGEAGVSILLVEQNARLSLAIADRAYLIENGHITGEGRAAALANDPAVQKAYLGGGAASIHRRFGESEIAVPLAAGGAAATAADLADRASRIQRAYVEARRGGGVSHANGNAVHMSDHPIATEPIVMSKQASELSRTADAMARRASEILAAHVAKGRGAVPQPAAPPAAAVQAPASDLSRSAEDLAQRATQILAAHIAERREVEAVKAKPPGKKGKKDKPTKSGKRSKKDRR